MIGVLFIVNNSTTLRCRRDFLLLVHERGDVCPDPEGTEVTSALKQCVKEVVDFPKQRQYDVPELRRHGNEDRPVRFMPTRKPLPRRRPLALITIAGDFRFNCKAF